MDRALRHFLKDYVDHNDDLSVDDMENEFDHLFGIRVDEDLKILSILMTYQPVLSKLP